MSEDSRFPASVYEVGEEPDARFSMANERTFLAWIRTALALLAAGIALEAFDLALHPGFRLAASLVLIGVGTLIPLNAWWSWARTERALRSDKPLPSNLGALPLGIAVGVAGLLVVCGVLWR